MKQIVSPSRVAGQEICSIHTLKSWFDHDCIEVETGDGEKYRLPCSTIIQMVNEFTFTTERKSKHTYLVEATPLDDVESDSFPSLAHQWAVDAGYTPPG